MFVDEQRERFGVEPICRVLGVSASAYYQRATGARSARRVEDERLLELIRELHRRNYFAYGSWRMWKALLRAGEQVGRGRVERLMHSNGIQGAKRRGKPWRTTYPNANAYRPADLVERDFAASRPDELWFADFTYLRLLGRRRLLRLRDRRLQPRDRRLAVRSAHAHRPRPRRAADGARPTRSRRRCRARASQRRRQPRSF